MEEVFSHHNSAKLRRNLKIGVGLFAAFKATISVISYFTAKSEVAYRKRQLSKPVYELKDDELVNPPWNNSNIDDWLYRRGRITR